MYIPEDELAYLKKANKDKLYEELTKYRVDKEYKTIATFLAVTTFVLIIGLMVLSVIYTNGYFLIGTLVPIAIVVLYRIYIKRQINKINEMPSRNYEAMDTIARTTGISIDEMLKDMIMRGKVARL